MISAAAVKKLRERTGVGMMECKKALLEVGGDMELAIENLRKSGKAKADKKSNRVAADGRIVISSNKKYTVIISAEIENQINHLEADEKKNYMKMINLKETGLNILIKKGYDLLQLETFFTSGPEESRAWTIPKNCTALQAAGIIHTDFEKGFIRSETVSYYDFVQNNGWANSKTSGKMRLEGKDYIVKDGDVLNIRFNT